MDWSVEVRSPPDPEGHLTGIPEVPVEGTSNVF
jgi:hypothetical protein